MEKGGFCVYVDVKDIVFRMCIPCVNYKSQYSKSAVSRHIAVLQFLCQ